MIELTSAISSIKTMGDIAAFLLKATISTEVTQKAIELQSTIRVLGSKGTENALKGFRL